MPSSKPPKGVYVHPSSISESSRIGQGTRIWAFTHVMKGAIIGRHCNICDHSYIEGGARIGNHVKIKNGVSVWDGVTLGDEVFVGPHVVFTNVLTPRSFIKADESAFVKTKVQRGATLGAGAVIVCGTTIGKYAFVAAGAVVTSYVPDHGFVAGNPARLKGYACKCLRVRYPLSQPETWRRCRKCGFTPPVKK